jgi:hypothetical protein
MRASYAFILAALVPLAVACGGDDHGGDGSGGDGGPITEVDACVGLQCRQVTCPPGGPATTTLSGTVFAPNGSLPLYNVNVYVPNSALDPFTPGAQCDRCGSPLSGNPVVQAISDTEGKFVLENVPVVDNLPLVIQVGKWRRQVVVPTVAQCEDTALPMELTRLPRNKSEGDIPQMALSTGGADALECLLRKIGLDDSEFTNASGSGRVHLFVGTGGTSKFSPALGGADFANAQTLWDTVDHLRTYDVTFLSCEGGQNPGTKPDTARQALSDYTNLGGRVFMSHWHNYWVEAGPGMWPQTITPNHRDDLGSVTADVNTGFGRGADLAAWLVNVNASTQLGKIALTDTQHTVDAVSDTLTERWISLATTANGAPSVQYYQFTTPLEVEATQRCGKAVFSDIHVSTGDAASHNPYPTSCTTSGLTPQEKVLAFMIFDIAGCVGPPIGREPGQPGEPVTSTVTP